MSALGWFVAREVRHRWRTVLAIALLGIAVSWWPGRSASSRPAHVLRAE